MALSDSCKASYFKFNEIKNAHTWFSGNSNLNLSSSNRELSSFKILCRLGCLSSYSTSFPHHNQAYLSWQNLQTVLSFFSCQLIMNCCKIFQVLKFQSFVFVPFFPSNNLSEKMKEFSSLTELLQLVEPSASNKKSIGMIQFYFYSLYCTKQKLCFERSKAKKC